ncbi:MAG: flagellar biosynthesis protein FlhB [Proteobacteria bacterium SG_bin5]|nr:flagellar type III secretion system protein FlhB [Sphingomonas sp.]OQW39925.1 MAG: flagellar biosynthesis protein FlhB [Proteobacteria bacterium SG_bin5]
MAEQEGDKTESPTAKRRQDAAKEGNILRSRDFATALTVLAGCAWIALFGPQLFDACRSLMRASLSFGAADVADFQPLRPLAAAGWQLAPAMIALFAISIVAAIASQAGLGSLSFNSSLLAPKANRLDPMAGIKRIFGPSGWIELGKSLLKVLLLGAIGWYVLRSIDKQSVGLVSTDVRQSVASLGTMLVQVLFAMAGGLVLIALIDVPLQLFQLMNKLRMTKQEVKDEHKETEGNPEAKGAQRARMHAMAKRNMKKAVASAQVVLTNPTHFAVALRYERGQDQVPVVVAKGRGVTALAIRELAAENDVPCLEYPMLARAVYYTAREGQEIRDDLYQAVATVLAFVFGLNAQAAPPKIDVPPTARFDENGQKLARG